MTAHNTCIQTYAVRTNGRHGKSHSILHEVLLDRTPVDRWNKHQLVCRAVGIFHSHHGILYGKLHGVGRASHQQIGMRSLARQRNGDAVGIIVPQTGIGNILALGRCAERQAWQDFERSVLHHAAQLGVVYLGEFLR